MIVVFHNFFSRGLKDFKPSGPSTAGETNLSTPNDENEKRNPFNQPPFPRHNLNIPFPSGPASLQPLWRTEPTLPLAFHKTLFVQVVQTSICQVLGDQNDLPSHLGIKSLFLPISDITNKSRGSPFKVRPHVIGQIEDRRIMSLCIAVAKQCYLNNVSAQASWGENTT